MEFLHKDGQLSTSDHTFRSGPIPEGIGFVDPRFRGSAGDLGNWLAQCRRLRLRENSDICLKCGYDLRARQTAAPNAAAVPAKQETITG